MATYQYENSDHERFQQLAQALLLPDYPRLQCLPVGQPDGGRDGVIHDDQDLKDAVVVQVKFKRSDEPSVDATAWVIAALEGERASMQRIVKAGAKRYIFVTNVRGTAHRNSGSIDRVRDWFVENLPIPAQCLWRDDLDRRLEQSIALQWRYPEVLSGPNAIHLALAAHISEDAERRSTALRQFVAHQFKNDSEVRFKQIDLRNDLLSLFVDVPAAINSRHGTPEGVDRVVFKAYNRLPSSDWEAYDAIEFSESQHVYGWPPTVGMADLLLDADFAEAAPRSVIEGAPGQGKSTLGQYVCQVHRARLLEDANVLDAMPGHHRNSPVRFPIKVDLRDLATRLGGHDPFLPSSPHIGSGWEPSLEAFLARQITASSGGTRFETYDLTASLAGTPVLLFLDGLDEVVGVDTREDLIDAVRAGLSRLESMETSIQVVVTSRPAAFANSPGFPAREFVYMQLMNLTRSLLLAYTEKWIVARSLDDNDAADVRRILASKLDLPHIRDLARNPMQLAILLSLIHAVGYSLPDERTDLYASYMERFLTREAEKSPAVQRHRKLLVKIHQYLAWILQSRAESASGLSGSVTSEELRALIVEYLREREYPTDIVDELFTGVLERVYVLVQRIEGAYEFEVQPLREYFCATYLYETAPHEPVGGGEPSGSRRERFEALAQNPYWTNVIRFYAGCYKSGELGGLFMQLEALRDERGRELTFRPRYLGATLLGDWVFKESPRATRHVAELVFDALGLKVALTLFGQGPEGVLQLPHGCGRDELGAQALEAAFEAPGGGSITELIGVARANMTTALGAKILDGVRESEGRERSQRLHFAIQSGAVEGCAAEECLNLLTGDEPSDEEFRARSIMLAKWAPSLAEAIVPVRDRVVEFALSGRLSTGPRALSWIGALSNALSPVAFEFELRHGRRLGSGFRSADPEEWTLSVPDDLPGVRAFASRLASEPLLVERGRVASLQHARRLVDGIVDAFGEVWAAACIALVAASLPGPVGTRGEGVECTRVCSG